MITPEDKAILDALEFEPSPDIVEAAQPVNRYVRLAKAAGGAACLAVAYPIAEQFPMAPVDSITPPAFVVGLGIVATGIKLAYDAVRGR